MDVVQEAVQEIVDIPVTLKVVASWHASTRRPGPRHSLTHTELGACNSMTLQVAEPSLGTTMTHFSVPPLPNSSQFAAPGSKRHACPRSSSKRPSR